MYPQSPHKDGLLGKCVVLDVPVKRDKAQSNGRGPLFGTMQITWTDSTVIYNYLFEYLCYRYYSNKNFPSSLPIPSQSQKP